MSHHIIGKASQELLLAVLLLTPFLSTHAEVKEETIRRPDGTVETKTTTKYYNPSQERLVSLSVYGVSILLGGFIAVGGVWIVNKRNSRTDSDVDLDIRKQKLKITKLTQGGLVVLIGAGIIMWSIYRMRQGSFTRGAPSSPPPSAAAPKS